MVRSAALYKFHENKIHVLFVAIAASQYPTTSRSTVNSLTQFLTEPLTLKDYFSDSSKPHVKRRTTVHDLGTKGGCFYGTGNIYICILFFLSYSNMSTQTNIST